MIDPQQIEPEITDIQVADYLAEHPEFFVDKDSLLRDMVLPHQQGQAISLVERQVRLLRERNLDTRTKLDEFVEAARINNETFEKCSKLILDMIDAEDAGQFFDALESSFKRDFNCDAYGLIIFSETTEQINHFTSSISENAAMKVVGGLIKAKNPTLGILRPAEHDFLFRENSSTVQSAAVLPIARDPQQGKPIALLAIGSDDANYFKAGMGTIFISFIAQAIGQLLPKYIPRQ
ncbi:MAG: DUF484 family protein [Pseudomonadales bacterium]|jgi:uncharacterized protein YigA (DUF484 family)